MRRQLGVFWPGLLDVNRAYYSCLRESLLALLKLIGLSIVEARIQSGSSPISAELSGTVSRLNISPAYFTRRFGGHTLFIGLCLHRLYKNVEALTS